MNEIYVIHPYARNGAWVFDDESRELKEEPFVGGIDIMVDELTQDIVTAKDGFNLFFSSNPFPGHTVSLERLQEESGGYWYFSPQLGFAGWLCPALLKYFDEAPVNLYVQVKERR